MRDDKRLLVVEPEFSSVMARSRREGSTLAAVQRQAWEGRALSVLNRKQLAASASHVAMIGHVAPREFRLRLAETDMAGGTYNRYLPVYVERSRLLPVPSHYQQVVAAYARKLPTPSAGPPRPAASISARTLPSCGPPSFTPSSAGPTTMTTAPTASSPAAPRPTACASPGCTRHSMAAP